MACMACSMPVLDSFEQAGIAPIGVSNDWWFLPERSATCGMCMRVYMFDEGQGTHPLRDTVSQPWAYSAKVYEDPIVGVPYFYAFVVEWFDRYQSSGLDITYPIFQQRDQIGRFGVWSVGLEPVPCPVDASLTLNFMDYSKPYPESGSATEGSVWQASESAGVLPDDVSLCDNRYDVICGNIVHDPNRNPVSWPKVRWNCRGVAISYHWSFIYCCSPTASLTVHGQPRVAQSLGKQVSRGRSPSRVQRRRVPHAALSRRLLGTRRCESRVES